MLMHFEGADPTYKVITSRKLRGEARPFLLITLKKKYYMLEGMLAESFKKHREAQYNFLQCMRIGDKYFYPTIRREVIIRLAISYQ